MRTILLALCTVALSPAAVVLNAPNSHSAFYDGNSDFFNFDGTGLLAAISSAPYIFLFGEGSFTQATQVAPQFHFDTPGLGTSNGYFHFESSFLGAPDGSGSEVTYWELSLSVGSYAAPTEPASFLLARHLRHAV